MTKCTGWAANLDPASAQYRDDKAGDDCSYQSLIGGNT
jgi:hypothetical protein